MKKLNYIKNHFNFWVLQFTLFLSVFAFSGFNTNAELPISKTSQTELVLLKKKTPQKVISLKKAKRSFFRFHNSTKQFGFQKVELLIHHQLLLVTLKAVFLKYISYTNPKFFFSKRNILYISDLELPFLSFL